jgi:transcriptional regulator with XRE-family HTH domain
MHEPVIAESGGTLWAIPLEAIVLARKRRGTATPEGIETIAQRLARLRRERGITQQELAERLGVSQPIVSDYERGELRLHGELIVTLADLLGVSADELLGRAARSARGTAVKNRRLLRRIQEIDRLPKRDQQALLRTIDAFLTRAAS